MVVIYRNDTYTPRDPPDFPGRKFDFLFQSSSSSSPAAHPPPSTSSSSLLPAAHHVALLASCSSLLPTDCPPVRLPASLVLRIPVSADNHSEMAVHRGRCSCQPQDQPDCRPDQSIDSVGDGRPGVDLEGASVLESASRGHPKQAWCCKFVFGRELPRIARHCQLNFDPTY